MAKNRDQRKTGFTQPKEGRFESPRWQKIQGAAMGRLELSFHSGGLCAIAPPVTSEAVKGLQALDTEVGLDTLKIYSNSGNFWKSVSKIANGHCRCSNKIPGSTDEWSKVVCAHIQICVCYTLVTTGSVSLNRHLSFSIVTCGRQLYQFWDN